VSASHAFVASQEDPEDEPPAEIVHIEGKLSDDLVLTRPVRVEVWPESGEFVADVAELNLHAFGATPDEAIANLREALVAQRQRFLTLRDRLSPSMRRDAELLEAAIQPRHA
jgi:hypothetical protein